MSFVTTAPADIGPSAHIITMSPNYASGLSIGVFLLMMVAFAMMMMLDIQTSDTMGLPDNAYALPQKKEE